MWCLAVLRPDTVPGVTGQVGKGTRGSCFWPSADLLHRSALAPLPSSSIQPFECSCEPHVLALGGCSRARGASGALAAFTGLAGALSAPSGPSGTCLLSQTYQ